MNIQPTLVTRASFQVIARQLLDKAGIYHLPKSLSKRIVLSGIRKDELESVLRQAKHFDKLSHLFFAVAEARESKGRYWWDLGLKPKAKDYFFNAALWAFYATLLSREDADFQRQAYAGSAKNYALAAPYFKFAAKPIEIPYATNTIKGYMRLPVIKSEGTQQPAPDKRFPCVIFINGFNSTKEELFFSELPFLNLGIATITFDQPAIAQALGESKSSPAHYLTDIINASTLGNALQIFISSQPQIDQEKVALHGISLGGAMALVIAAEFADCYKAVTCVSAPVDLRDTFEHLTLDSFHQANYVMVDNYEIIDACTRRLYVKDLLADVRSSLLVIAGGKDPLAGSACARTIYDQASAQDKKLLLCPKAGHVCYEMMPSLRYEIAQWVNRRFSYT